MRHKSKYMLNVSHAGFWRVSNPNLLAFEKFPKANHFLSFQKISGESGIWGSGRGLPVHSLHSRLRVPQRVHALALLIKAYALASSQELAP